MISDYNKCIVFLPSDIINGQVIKEGQSIDVVPNSSNLLYRFHEFIYPVIYSAFVFYNYRFVQPQEVSMHPSTVFCFSNPLYHTIASCAWV